MSKKCEHGVVQSSCSICDVGQVFRRYQRKSADRGIPFLLTDQQFREITLQPCHYCGEIGYGRGIDRVDNFRGYELVNCVSCCGVCNKIKGTLTRDFLLQHIEKMFRQVQKNKQLLEAEISQH